MRFAPNEVYPDRRAYTLVIFDLRIPDASDRLHRERAEWQEQSEIEAIDQDHFVLIVHAGGAWRLTA